MWFGQDNKCAVFGSILEVETQKERAGDRVRDRRPVRARLRPLLSNGRAFADGSQSIQKSRCSKESKRKASGLHRSGRVRSDVDDFEVWIERSR